MHFLVLPTLFFVEKPESQLDFWLGDWDLKIATRPDPRKDNWTRSSGKNRIEMTL